MFILDYTDRRPIYEQIISRIQEQILRGILTKDMPLPSVRSLAMELSINPNTIQRAYMALEQAGWIYSVKGRGSFVADAAQAREDRRRTVLNDLVRVANEAALAGFTKEDFLKAAEALDWPGRKEEP